VSLFPKSQHLVVAGAGYAGLPFALRLGRMAQKSGKRNLRLTLINPEPHQELTCEYYKTLRDFHRSKLPFVANLKI